MAAKKPVIKNPLDTYFKGIVGGDEYNNAIKAGWTTDEVASYILANYKPNQVAPGVEKELKTNTNYANWTKETDTSTGDFPIWKPPTTPTKTNHNLDATNAALFNKYVDDNPDLLQTWNAGEWQDKFASKADAGYDHWINNGKNEDRAILDVPKISYANGQLTLINKDYIGAAAQEKYNSIINTFNNSNGGNYRQLLTNLSSNLDSTRVQDLFNTGGVDALNGYYLKNKVGGPWDAATYAAQPPAGGFDVEYYAKNNPRALDGWNQAQAVNVGSTNFVVPDLDITGRYTRDTYLAQHYTSVGKPSGYRGNAALDAGSATNYKEILTDADYQTYRDSILGIGATFLGQEVEKLITEKDSQQQQTFGTLTQDALKQSIAELNKAKTNESKLAFMRQLPGYDEIYSINSSLANSVIGDSGIGGLLSFTGSSSDKITKDLEKEFSGITGVETSSNSVLYNWQKWFDDTLIKRYEEGIDLGIPGEASNQYKIDKQFATKFINDYLKPRFDTSRSMDEFISYIDVTDKDQNIFQTQTALDSLKQYADSRAKTYLDQLKGQAPNTFNSEFYFAPTPNSAKTALYEKQKKGVAEDWEAAKKGDALWAKEAYRYGLDIKDKNQFARLHYEVKGRGEGFDPAVDILTVDDAQNFVSKTLIPAVTDKKTYLGDASFLQFVTPEEFTDELLKGVDPVQNKEEWDKILKQFGLTDQGAGVQQVKEYIMDVLRTGAAKDIRESLKYLNEKKVTPTQAELGTTYIQRAEDIKPIEKTGETPLFTMFKSAGYKGTEDEFYTNFMPDADRSEQEFLSKAGSKGGLNFLGVDTSDPFTSLSSIDKLFATADETERKTTTKKDTPAPSYFKLFGGDTEEPISKSKSGQQILGEFTSLFK